MSDWTKRINIEPLFYRVKRENVKFLKPSHNLRKTRDPFDQLVVENTLEVNTTAQQILLYVNKRNLNTDFNSNRISAFRKLKLQIDIANKKFIKWSISFIEEVERLWVPHIKKILTNHLATQDILLFENILVNTLYTIINKIVDSDEVKRLADAISITSDSNDSVIFCGKYLPNLKFSELQANCIYYNPLKEFEAYMRNKDVELLMPIREIWNELQAYDWCINNEVNAELNSQTDIQLRQNLLLANYKRLLTKYGNQKDAIKAFLRQEVPNVDNYRWPQKGMSYETIKKDVQKLFPKG